RWSQGHLPILRQTVGCERRCPHSLHSHHSLHPPHPLSWIYSTSCAADAELQPLQDAYQCPHDWSSAPASYVSVLQLVAWLAVVASLAVLAVQPASYDAAHAHPTAVFDAAI